SFLTLRHPPCSTLFPYTTLFRSTDPTATTFEEFFVDEDDLRRVVYSSYLDVTTQPDDRSLLFYMQDAKSDNAYSRNEGDNQQRRSEEHTSELQSREHLVCRLLLE